MTSTGDAGPELPPGAALGVTPHGTPSMQSLADLEIQIEQARCRAVIGDDFLRTMALREAGCICTPGRLAGGPKAHAEDLRCPVHKEVSGGPV